MHCVEFEMRLNARLDERRWPAADAELAAHADECDECAALLLAHEALLDATDSPAIPSAGPDLAVRVAAECSRPARSIDRSPLRSTSRWLGPAIAASALIAIVAWRAITATPAGAPNAQHPSSDARQPTIVDVENGSATLLAAPSMREPDRAYRQFVTDTEDLAEDLSASRLTLMTHVEDGLKPVTDSMSAALNALRRTLPGSEANTRSS